MEAFNLIRERWHSDATTPAERSFLLTLIAALHRDFGKAVK